MFRDFELVNSKSGEVRTVTANPEGSNWRALCPFHPDTKPSLSINVEKGVFNCFGCHAKGKASHVGEVTSAGERNHRVVEATYDYFDEGGTLLYRVVRYKPKTFVARRQDGQGGWTSGVGDVRRVLYRLPELISSQGTVFITEGEKDADTLTRFGLTATTNAFGARGWNSAFGEFLRGRDVVVLPDNDIEGIQRAESIAKDLVGKARSIKVVNLRGLAEKEDISDWLGKHGHTIDELNDLVSGTSPVEAAPEEGTKEQAIPVIPVFMSSFYPRPFTEDVCNHFRLFAEGTSKKDDLFYYDESEGLWREDAESVIDSYLRKGETLDIRHKKHNAIEEIKQDVRGVVYRQDRRVMPEPPLALVPLKNGVFDLDNGTLRPFEPSDYFRWKLPWAYNPHGNDELVSLVDSFVAPDARVDLWELMAYTLVRAYSYHKFFFLVGKGSNGKSLFINLCRNLIGDSNVVAVSLGELVSNGFSRVALRGKLLNAAGDINYRDIEDTALLKQLTGEDMIYGDRKYMNPISFTNYAKLVFAGNRLPETSDYSDGFFRRAFIIEFPFQFPQNPSLTQRVNNVKALGPAYEGLLFEALQRLSKLRRRGFIFTNHKEAGEMRKEYERRSNPVVAFIDERCVRSADASVTKQSFLEALNCWLGKQGKPPYTHTRLGKFLKSLGIEEGKRSIFGGKRESYWLGIGLAAA